MIEGLPLLRRCAAASAQVTNWLVRQMFRHWSHAARSISSTFAVGPAILLAPKDSHAAGSTGLFFEAAPLGLEVHTRVSRLAFVFEAFSLALSAPVLGPDPVIQTQYRATLGLRF